LFWQIVYNGVKDTGMGGQGMVYGIFQPMHLLVILVIAVLFFGNKKLSELAKALDESFRGGPRGGPPTHPIPVTGPVEKSGVSRRGDPAVGPERKPEGKELH
jgi:TatA/E family protein of Tat protein translocase